MREPYSAKLLDKLGVKNYQIVVDIAILVRADRSNHSFIYSEAIGVAPAMLKYTLTKEEVERYVVAHAHCLDELATHHEEIVFLSSSDDIVMCQMIMAKMKDPNRAKIIVTNDVDEYESSIRGLKLLLATRMHPSIIAFKNFIPIIPIIYDHRQIGFLSQIGLKELSIPINKISYDNLRLKINEVIENYAKIEEALKSIVPKLQERYKAKLLHFILNLTRK